MSDRHTVGTWHVDEVDNEGEYGNGGPDSHVGFKSFCVVDDDGNVLFDSLNATASEVREDYDDETGHHRAWDEVAHRNLRLAAEAPELLKHLRHAIRFFDQLTKADADRYSAAIAKATGSTT